MSYQSTGGALDWLGTAIKGTANVYGQTQQDKALAELEKQRAAAGTTITSVAGGMPDWLLPVAVIGGLGVLALVLTKKG